MDTLYNLTLYFVGSPSDEIQAFALYFGSIIMSVLMVFSFIYLMKLVIEVFKS